MRWLLLRGLVREQRHWLDFPAVFESRVRGLYGRSTRVHLLDLPGFGRESGARVPRSVPEFVDALRVRLQAEVGDEPCGIMAVSLGGMVALAWLARHPTDFKAGVVINSSLGDLSPIWHRMRPINWPSVIVAPLLGHRARERMLLGMTRRQGDLDRDADRYAQIALGAPPRPDKAWAQIRAAMRMKSPERIDVPTLILASKGDGLVSYRSSEAIARRLGLPIRLHQGEGAAAAGHDLPLDAPDWVCDQINAWLADRA